MLNNKIKFGDKMSLVADFAQTYELSLLNSGVITNPVEQNPVSQELKMKVRDIVNQALVNGNQQSRDSILGLTTEIIGKGKAKVVHYIPSRPGYVYYTPVQDVLGGKQREIQAEVETAKNISRNIYVKGLFDALGEILHDDSIPDEETLRRVFETNACPAISKKMENLALDLVELKGDERVSGKYTVRTSKALHDLEAEITPNEKDSAYSFKSKSELIQGFFSGLDNLHQADYVHGDLKPENILIQEFELKGSKKKISKLSDFGKTHPIADGAVISYSGNPRFMAPERNLSKKGEVYSAAMIAIRVLEEGLLDKSTPILRSLSPEEVDTDVVSPRERRGIEKFVVENKKMVQTESTTLKGKFKAYAPSFIRGKIDFTQAQEEMHGYIDALIKKLSEKVDLAVEKQHSLRLLLKKMTLSDPAERPTMTEVCREFDGLIGDYN